MENTSREALKIQALLEKINKLENENADYRVEITIASMQLDELNRELTELKEQQGVHVPQEDPGTEPVDAD